MEDLHALLKELNLAPAVLFGSSSGARVGIMLATAYPQV
jgi:pimeloyl-ACP methyl ester carboxylesterase